MPRLPGRSKCTLTTLLKGKTFVTLASNLPYEDYLRDLARHRFVLCPAGNGLDTHSKRKTWNEDEGKQLGRHVWRDSELDGWWLGNGLESLRRISWGMTFPPGTWESLLMGSVPVVASSPMDSLFRFLP
eukprot:768393-Hanusia_phi.AAC.5